MTREPVLTKDDMWKRWQRGEFGNRPHAWLSYEELVASGFDRPVVIRYKTPAAKWIKYGVEVAQVAPMIDAFVKDGADPLQFVFNEAVPDDLITIQGEYLRNCQGHLPGSLHYSTVPGTHRESLLNHGRHASGLDAKRLLKQWLDQESYDWLMELNVLYPEHVVEFSTFRRRLGDLRWNTIFWEVRLY